MISQLYELEENVSHQSVKEAEREGRSFEQEYTLLVGVHSDCLFLTRTHF